MRRLGGGGVGFVLGEGLSWVVCVGEGGSDGLGWEDGTGIRWDLDRMRLGLDWTRTGWDLEYNGDGIGMGLRLGNGHRWGWHG